MSTQRMASIQMTQNRYRSADKYAPPHRMEYFYKVDFEFRPSARQSVDIGSVRRFGFYSKVQLFGEANPIRHLNFLDGLRIGSLRHTIILIS